MPPVKLPFHHSPHKVAVPREETASSRLPLEAEIDQFHLKEEEDTQERPVELSNSEGELDKSSATHSPKLIITQVDSSSEEEDIMAFNLRKGLKEILVERNKGSSSKNAPKTQLPPNLPPPPFPCPFGLLLNPNL